MEAIPAGLSARKAHEQLLAALVELRRAERNAVLCFAEILRRKLYRELGYSSIHSYAESELGFSQSKTYQFIGLAESLGKLPRLRESLQSGELPWTKAVAVARVATPRSERKWIAEAKQSSRRELERKVKTVRQRSRWKKKQDSSQLDLAVLSPEFECVEEDIPVCVSLRLSPEQHARLQASLEKLRKRGRRESREELLLEAIDRLSREEDDYSRLESGSPMQIVIYRCEECGGAKLPDGRPVSRAIAEAAACDCCVQKPGEPNRASIKPSVRREVLARDRHRCRVKGCGRTSFLEVHHLVPRSAGGENKPENLVTLCASCHRLLHERGLVDGALDGILRAGP